MKIKVLLFLFILFPPSLFAGADASGGGTNVRTRIREAKIKAISVLEYFSLGLRPQEELDLMLGNLNATTASLFIAYGQRISEELKDGRSEFVFFSKEKDRKDFFINGEEKTFKTKHYSGARIDVNLLHAIETQMTLNSGAALLMREGARHLEIEEEQKLDEIEEMALALLYAYDVIRGLREEDVLTLEEEPAQAALNSIRRPYHEIQKAQNMTYLYEDFFHYYLEAEAFSESERELIHEAFWKAEEFFVAHHFPVHYEFRGEHTNHPEYRENIFSLMSDEFQLLDGKNVIYKTERLYQRKTDIFGINKDSFKEVSGMMDMGILDAIRDHSYDDEKNAYPCMCDVVARLIVLSLGLGPILPRLDQPSSYYFGTSHQHHSFFDQLSEEEKRSIENFLARRVVVVQKPELTFLLETEDFDLYQTLNGIYLKFKDSFIEEYGTEELRYRRFSVIIRRKNIPLGFKLFDFLEKDKELAVAQFRGGALRTDDLLFYLHGTEPDPMLVHYARGGNVVVEPFVSEDVLAGDEEVDIEIRLLKDSLGIYSDPVAYYPDLRLPAMPRSFWNHSK